jgi:hypothetical protein
MLTLTPQVLGQNNRKAYCRGMKLMKTIFSLIATLALMGCHASFMGGSKSKDGKFGGGHQGAEDGTEANTGGDSSTVGETPDDIPGGTGTGGGGTTGGGETGGGTDGGGGTTGGGTGGEDGVDDTPHSGQYTENIEWTNATLWVGSIDDHPSHNHIQMRIEVIGTTRSATFIPSQHKNGLGSNGGKVNGWDQAYTVTLPGICAKNYETKFKVTLTDGGRVITPTNSAISPGPLFYRDPSKKRIYMGYETDETSDLSFHSNDSFGVILSCDQSAAIYIEDACYDQRLGGVDSTLSRVRSGVTFADEMVDWTLDIQTARRDGFPGGGPARQCDTL